MRVSCRKCRTKKAKSYVRVFVSADNDFKLCPPCWGRLNRVVRRWMKE